MKRDKIVGGGGQVYAKIDEELDRMVEENMALQEEERQLMSTVKKLQHKKKDRLAETSSKIKKLTQTLDKSPNKGVSIYA